MILLLLDHPCAKQRPKYPCNCPGENGIKLLKMLFGKVETSYKIVIESLHEVEHTLPIFKNVRLNVKHSSIFLMLEAYQ